MNNTNAPRDRATWTALTERPNADVLIIGGGINGLATFRDLAMQGIDVALIERHDYASGASAASSHMIHGGVRYLENGEFRLVREAVIERNDLLRTAPHYVRPLQTTIPITKTFSGLFTAPLRFFRHGAGPRRERGALLIKVGLILYDSFSRDGGTVPRHTFRGRRRSMEELPQLHQSTKYTATYWDASVHDPERLALDVLRDGKGAGHDQARASNYVAAVGIDGEGRTIIRDEVTGAELSFNAKVIINVTGPWTDLTNTALGRPSKYMGGTKGSHIVIDNAELLEATNGRELFFENSDGRIVLIHPMKGRVLVGTSDLEHDMADPVQCTEEEVDYFIDLIGQVLPDIQVDRSQIVYRFSGVRPLPGHDDLAPGFVSRDYRIEEETIHGASESTLLSLVGGKLTTFRASAESLADAALRTLGRDRKRHTRGVAIGGGRGFPTSVMDREAWVAKYANSVGADRANRLLERYGTVASEVISELSKDPSDAPLTHAPEYSTAEFRYLAKFESVVHLDDILQRRTSIAFVGGASQEAAHEIADAIAPILNWDESEISAEVQRALTRVNAAHPNWPEEQVSTIV
ncbi:MAG: FAD-dependent oxidoreductase [Gulosibacter sp.]|uniref:glycerol-3-phosphate dehydrogenase/oxidase n=1 Tax=Gulosibacter sp. TaxID=2817531 RepID=UPI003F931DBC